MSNLRFFLAAARVVAAMALAFLVIKISPTLFGHAAGHAGTYAAPVAASQPAPGPSHASAATSHTR